MTSEAVCGTCGVANSGDANFCSACGTPLGQRTEETTGRIPQAGVDVAGSGEVGQLIVTRGPTAGSRFAITDQVVSIGRNTDSQVFLNDITVSRDHAEIRRNQDGTYTLSDRSSLNGTYLDGDLITHAALREGAQVQIGKFRLVFVIGALGESA
ncbi:MAG: FHA domain-containing protein [Microthrixaceae bacterium]